MLTLHPNPASDDERAWQCTRPASLSASHAQPFIRRWWQRFRHPVFNPPVEGKVVEIPHYLQGFNIHSRWLGQGWKTEPSTVSCFRDVDIYCAAFELQLGLAPHAPKLPLYDTVFTSLHWIKDSHQVSSYRRVGNDITSVILLMEEILHQLM